MEMLKRMGLTSLVLENHVDHDMILLSERLVRRQHINELVLMCHDNEWFEHLTDEELERCLDCWSPIQPTRALPASLVYAHNWAMGAMSNCQMLDCIKEYGEWADIFQHLVEGRCGLHTLNVNPQRVDELCGLKDYIAMRIEMLQGEDAFEAAMLNNCFRRSWFLSWLYLFAGDQDVITTMNEQPDDVMSAGDELLYKMLQVLMIATSDNVQHALNSMAQFMEAFLIGHMAYWNSSFRLYDGLLVFRRWSEIIRDMYTTKFVLYSVCKHHIDRSVRNNAQELQMGMLHLHGAVYWDKKSGLFNCWGETMEWTCHRQTDNGILCGEHTFKTRIEVTSSVESKVLINFGKRVPDALWTEICNGWCVRIGTCARICTGAIFEIGAGQFMAAYPIRFTGNRWPEWWYWNTVDGVMEFSDRDHAHAQCRVLVFEAPPKCGHCGMHWEDRDNMRRCGACNRYIHRSCYANALAGPGLLDCPAYE